MQKSFLHDPLLHFLIAGGVLFWFGYRPQERSESLNFPPEVVAEASSELIELNTQTAEEIVAAHAEMAGKSLSTDEKSEVLQNYLDQEILVREAFRLELHKHDKSVRQRLIAKMKFLYVGPLPDPPVRDLKTYFELNVEKYVAAETLTLDHVLYSLERIDDTDKIKDVIKSLDAGASAEALTQPNWLGPKLRNLSKREISQLMGAEAADGIWSITNENWNGPFYSSHGTHFVRVTDRVDSRLPEFESVANMVANDWKQSQQERILDGKVKELKKKYEFKIDDTVSQLLK